MKLLSAILAAFLGIVGASSASAQTSQEIRETQSLLVRTDRNPGPVDGIWGARTEAALIEFLQEQDLEFDGTLSENELELLRNARWGERYRLRPYRVNGRIVEHFTTPRGLTRFPNWGDGELPMWLDPPPNDITVGYHFNLWLKQKERWQNYMVMPSEKPRPLVRDLKSSSFLNDQMAKSSALSYLYYADGRVIYDAMASPERFDFFELTEDTEFRSQSVGKSFVAYLVGHAICQGYIDSVDTQLNDWPLIENTLYSQRTVAEILDMRARDQNVVDEYDGLIASGGWFNGQTLREIVGSDLEGTKPASRAIWNYNGLATNLMFSYVVHKSGEDFQNLLDFVFRDYVGIEHRLFFPKHRNFYPDEDGTGWGMVYANREDYLRIAVAMLEDWNKKTCVGNFLRDIYDRRQAMNHGHDAPDRMPDVALSYAGYFWLDFRGMRNRKLFGMNGNNGQNVLIDMDRGRIVVLNAAHTNFDWRALVYNAIRNGGLPN